MQIEIPFPHDLCYLLQYSLELAKMQLFFVLQLVKYRLTERLVLWGICRLVGWILAMEDQRGST